ncbi:MAG: hypothetical protein RMY31_035400 [Dendronalium sp. ChiSLP03b]
MQFNDEPIFFDFGYAGYPKLFGLILYFGEFETPEQIAANIDAVKQRCIPFINQKYGVTGQTLRVFPLAKNVMDKLRNTPLWAFDTQIEIANPNDKQLIFAGRTEQELEEFFVQSGFAKPQTKRTYKGFRKRDL